MRTYLVRIPHRKGHSIQSDVLLASAIAGPNRRIHGPPRVGPNGRDLKLPPGNSDRTTGLNQSRFLHSPLWFVRFDNHFGASTIPLAWTEDRALPRSNPSAVPGAKTEWGGTMPPSAIRDWHPGAKSSCPAVRTPPRRRALAYPLTRTVVSPFRLSPPPRRPGTA